MSLKSILKEVGINYDDISNTLGIKSHSTISLKINGKANFTTVEASKLKKMLEEKSGRTYTFEELFENQN